jgi:hypothetical protein
VCRYPGFIQVRWCSGAATLSDECWRTIMIMTRRAESALESFADTSVLYQLNAAKALE